MSTENEVLPTENPQWGFWGTISNSENPDVKAPDAWALAMGLITEATKQPGEVVRAFLDSKDGRHFADEVGNFLEDRQSLPDAIEAAIKRWMVPANRSASFSHIPDGVTYLMACVVEHAEAEANT
ncbi:hypothetical protein [Pseudomonas aeruginosa]|uniref:hypothetical protein n=1 Tax=Pseudomonas aeruginosa TaxID=287 RepID=UPI003D2B8850